MTSQYPSSTTTDPDLNRSAHIVDATTSTSTNALRPRNRRLISTELTSPGPGNRGNNENRAVSPIPSRHPSRIVGSQRVTSEVVRPVGGLVRSSQDGTSGTLSPAPGFGKGLWDSGWTGSWTALQGLASSVLGTDVVESNGNGDRAGSGRNAKDAARKRARGNSGASKVPATWGPSGSLRKRGDSIGVGSTAERDLAVKARKTASVLESHEGANGGLDVSGNYKRRTSLERPGTPGQPFDGQDELVYVHHVQSSDTLAGVVLKYNCQPAVFRKANGLYPNDMIQVRKVVFLPVDACSIKGRPCDPPTDNKPIDLLAPTPDIEDPPSSMESYANGGAWGQKFQGAGTTSTPLFNTYNTQETKTEEEDKPWAHVRWVLLDSSPSAKPVEIARLPRKTLGYFPPRRRKSQVPSSSITSTPRGSFDIHNVSEILQEQDEGAAGIPPRLLSGTASPSQGASYFPSPIPNVPARAENFANQNATPMWLRGPGGVGTFNVRSPGPAQDGLNSWATKHVPMLGIGYLQSSSVVGGDMISYGFEGELNSIAEMPRSYPTAAGSGTATPSGSGQSIGIGLENAAAAIEGWVRRLAVKAAPGTPKLGGGNHKAAPELGEGDLIELLDGAGSDDGRGFEPVHIGSSRPAVGASSGRDDHAAIHRGRLYGAASAKGKSE